MPLSIGLLGVVPVQFTIDALINKLLPLWLCLLFSVGWLNRGSRHALLAELPGWALAVPLASTVLMSLWGKVLPFRITPKHRVRKRGGISLVLALPLLALILLNMLNLISIITSISWGQLDSGLGLGLLWACLNLLALFVALRVCWDRPCPDPTPWLQINLKGWLINTAGRKQSVNVVAISEKGAELSCQKPWPIGADWKFLLDPASLNGVSLPAIEVEELLLVPGLNQNVQWEKSEIIEIIELKRWLFGRAGAWPNRQAPPEWQAFFALISRLLFLPKQISSAGNSSHR